VIAIRLARVGDFVVSMSVVQPDADLLVLTETGYGKRVPLTEFRTMHRGSQGVRLISLEGRKTGDVAAVQQVTELDDELLLISAGGQVVRTDVNTINRQHAQARGVITMRMNEGDRVVAISAFRMSLADGTVIGDNDEPGVGPAPAPGDGSNA
jgi:DNA gyrase subunit A